MVSQAKVPGKVKLAYGVGNLSESVCVNTFYIYFIYFLTDVAGINPSAAGNIALVCILWSAFTDLYAGYKSDTSKSPLGRRRSFLYKFAIPLGVMSILLYSDFLGLSGVFKIAYMVIICVIWWTMVSFVDIPYQSLAPELTDDYQERTVIRAYNNTFNYIGMIIASSCTLMLAASFSADKSYNDPGGWSITAVIYGIIIAVGFLLSAVFTKGKDKAYEPVEGEDAEKMSLKAFIEVAKLKPVVSLMAYSWFAYTGIIIFMCSYTYYLLYVVGFNEQNIAVLLLFSNLVVIAITIILGKIGNVIEKRTLTFVFTILFGVGLIIFRFMNVGAVGAYVMFFLYALAFAAFFVPVFAMIYDSCNVDEYVHKGGREGIVVSLLFSTWKINAAVAMFVSGWILNLTGYDGAAVVQTAEAINGIKTCTLLIPGILCILGALAILKYPITEKRFDALRNAIAQKKKGLPYSEDGFRELL